jgi:hypothetical protein
MEAQPAADSARLRREKPAEHHAGHTAQTPYSSQSTGVAGE